MIVFFSGGSPICETSLKHPCIMPTYIMDVTNGKPGTRFKKLMELRRKGKKNRKRKKGKK